MFPVSHKGEHSWMDVTYGKETQSVSEDSQSECHEESLSSRLKYTFSQLKYALFSPSRLKISIDMTLNNSRTKNLTAMGSTNSFHNCPMLFVFVKNNESWLTHKLFRGKTTFTQDTKLV